jgi:hypothetical protein
MRWFFRLILLLLLVGGWTLAASAVHVVRSRDANSGKDRWILVPKSRLSFTDTYADVRNWSPSDAAAHRPLVRRLIDAEKATALAHLVPPESRNDPTMTAAALITISNHPATLPATNPSAPPD